MKKTLFLLILLAFPIFVDAECTYKEKYELNALSSYIDYTYDYNENSQVFTVNLFNIDEKLELRYENKVYTPNGGKVTLNNVEPGSRLSIDVYSTIQNECYNEHLRVVYISVPYFNRFYQSILCKGHEHLNICNSKFLDYQISNQTFILLLNNEEFTLNKDEEIIEIVDDERWYDVVIDTMQKYYIKFIVATISTVISISIFSVIYRKVKHKL